MRHLQVLITVLVMSCTAVYGQEEPPAKVKIARVTRQEVAENREFIALPYVYLVNNPVSTIPKSGTIVSATLSLGYDLHHLQIEPLIITAAQKSGLKAPLFILLSLVVFLSLTVFQAY